MQTNPLAYGTTGLWKDCPVGKTIDRRNVDELLTLFRTIHETLLDPVGLLDAEFTCENLLQVSKLSEAIERQIKLSIKIQEN